MTRPLRSRGPEDEVLPRRPADRDAAPGRRGIVTVDVWRDIRLDARRRHEQASTVGGLVPAATLVAAGLGAARLRAARLRPSTDYGPNALSALEREDGTVRLARGLDPGREAVVAARGLGHYWRHGEADFVVRSTEAVFGGDPMVTGAPRDGSRALEQRLGIEAGVFAQEFLLPADRLRERLVAGRERPSKIAEEMGLPEEFVRMQALRALLLPPLEAPRPDDRTGSRPPLDPGQREAAEWDDRPLIVDAGPGTGKTRTLVARVEHLLAAGMPPSAILALTFSNKAAAEMIERVERLDPAAAPRVWIGTFHAFGLELLRLHHAEAGLPADFEVLDEAGALGLIEGMLPGLDLRHYRDLRDPPSELRPILRAISRAKDELVSAEEYDAAAGETAARATTDDEVARAARVTEIARVYRAYEGVLHGRGAVDFGDLVCRSASLLAANPSVRGAVRAKYRRILVDEYQDVNSAGALLLDQLADAGRGVWAVADQRQAIYRFRGAAPANAAGFTDRYAGAERRQLKTNYRSCETVVRAFERFAADMTAAPRPAVRWEAKRGRVGFVETAHAPDLPSEAAALRDRIERLRAQGVPYERQAILGRTHLCLARFGRLLQDLGVPVLYLGDLFERPEIRDLLALVSLGADPAAAGLVRVAGFAEYAVSREDALLVIAAAGDDGDVVAACARAGTTPGVTPHGARGLALLARQLAGTGNETTAWHLVSRYLLETSDYLRPLLDASDFRSRQCLVAIHQFLRFAREHADAGEGRGGRLRFLEDVRRLERLDDARRFGLLPPEADALPAVRMMTVHASKGLEFAAVHLPQVATRHVPAPRRPTTCPAPLGLERLEIGPADHVAGEECLFFVALSRARDVLAISSAATYAGKQRCDPSRYLAPLADVLGTQRVVATVAPPAGAHDLHVPPPRTEYEERQLEVYRKCPARYRHEVVEGLVGLARKSPFLRFHECVRQTLAWVGDKAGADGRVAPQEALAHLEGVWAERGPVGSGPEGVYVAEARRMVENAARAVEADGRPIERVWSVTIAGRTVVVRPDRVVEAADGTIVAQRFRTGRRSSDEAAKPFWSLLAAAGTAMYPGREVRLEASYPATAESERIRPRRTGAELSVYVEALDGIERGDFRPRASRDCPNCQFYFICTSGDPS